MRVTNCRKSKKTCYMLVGISLHAIVLPAKVFSLKRVIKMMHHPLLQPYPQYCSSLRTDLKMDIFMTDSEDSFDLSSMLYFPSVAAGNSCHLYDFGSIVDDQIFSYMTEYTVDRMQVTEDSSATHLFSEYKFSDGSSPTESVDTSPEMMSVQSSVFLPMEDMELDDEMVIPCLFKAYGEAIENGQAELAEVILTRVKEKVSQTGSMVERAAYYLLQALNDQGEQLEQKSSKIYGAAALRAFYEILPYGRFAHLTANMAILESVPKSVQRIHIIDFDMGNGVQLASFIADIGRDYVVRITSIQWKGDSKSLQRSFQDTKRRLCEYAQSLGKKLTVDEMNMEELLRELIQVKPNDAGKEWLVFNCMVGLPHMGRQRSSEHVTEFLGIAEEAIRCKGGNSPKGIITLGEGDVVRERNELGTFFQECYFHFHALLESIESQFPSQLAEARLTMECLFLAPYISSVPCTGRWEEIKEHGRRFRLLTETYSWGFSQENFLQAKEIVKEGNSMYAVKLERPNQNLMSLSWKGIPLVKVSTWR